MKAIFGEWNVWIIFLVMAVSGQTTHDSLSVNHDSTRLVVSDTISQTRQDTSISKHRDTLSTYRQFDTMPPVVAMSKTSDVNHVKTTTIKKLSLKKIFHSLLSFRWILLIFGLLATLLILRWALSVRRPKQFLTTTRLSVMDKEVQRACRYIEKNYAVANLNEDSICGALITGRAFLEALFARELGMSIADFLNHVRINNAKVLLHANPSLTALEIAPRTGFSSEDEFQSVFKRYTQTTLSDYSASLSKKV